MRQKFQESKKNKIRELIQTLQDLTIEAAKAKSLVAARRKKEGPLQESWNVRTETTVEFARALQRKILDKPRPEQPEAFRSLLSIPLPVSMRLRKTQGKIADVDVLSFSTRRKKTFSSMKSWQMQNGNGEQKCLVHFHGGGYCFGSVENAAPFFSKLLLEKSETGAVWHGDIFSVDYALAPERSWPAALDDATAVVAELVAEYGADNVLLCGDSAGGGLAIATAISRRESGEKKVAGVIGVSPWVALTEKSRGYDRARDTDLLLEKTVRACKEWVYPASQKLPSSLDVMQAQLHELPSLLLLAGEAELFYDDVMHFADLVKEAGGEVLCHVGKEMPHIWPFFPMLGSESQQGLRAMVNFTHQMLPNV